MIYTPEIGRIRKIKKETRDARTFRIELENKELRDNFYFQPGEFVLISVFGIGEAPFSLSSSPSKKIFRNYSQEGRKCYWCFVQSEGRQLYRCSRSLWQRLSDG